jgi:hypothetical protein
VRKSRIVDASASVSGNRPCEGIEQAIHQRLAHEVGLAVGRHSRISIDDGSPDIVADPDNAEAIRGTQKAADGFGVVDAATVLGGSIGRIGRQDERQVDRHVCQGRYSDALTDAVVGELEVRGTQTEYSLPIMHDRYNHRNRVRSGPEFPLLKDSCRTV